MALTDFRLSRREWLLSLPACAGLLGGCSAVGQATRSTTLERELFRSPDERDARIVVFLPDTSQTREVWRALCDELSGDFQLIGVRTDSAADAPVIAHALDRHRPAALVLMNNPTLAAYGDYQRRHPGVSFPPAVVVMTSFLDGLGTRVQGATGISYEVPLITAATNLRRLLASSIERVGVIYRGALSGYVERQAELARQEQIEVVREKLSVEPNASELKRALRRVKQHAQAIWILNDDRLLTPRLIVDGWLPGIHERPWLPTMVGAASLVSAEQSFGTFAILPDHAALGVQAADLIFDIADNGFRLPREQTTQLPLSTTTILDLVQARERFSLREHALAQVDQVLK